ncbi:hypothetical protein [Sorangium sp. So ce1099]|uniref:hypothetical protein n=1 Tax=Sorangium sp. So ce1099 TaxID=3133331 RepID=UPI003F641234
MPEIAQERDPTRERLPFAQPWMSHAHRDLRHPIDLDLDLELGLGTDSIRPIVSDASADELLMGWAVTAAKRPSEKRRRVIA